MSSLQRLFQLQAQGRLGDRYRLDGCLGDGTYGFVWKAERLEDNEIVAVKIPKAQGGKNSDLEEGRALMDAPAHQNVVSVYWMGRVPPERELFVIEMEFFNSHTLAYLLDSDNSRFAASFTLLLDIYEQVLSGVSHLHALGISHGDIKPQNILIQGDLAKITDFGSSLHTQDIYARSRENGGTVLYSPPEFAGLTAARRSRELAVAHDVYSLGILLYQLLTGRLPHDTLAQVVRHTPFPTPRELNSSICPELESVTLRCLAKEPGDRYGSIDELQTAFAPARIAQSRLADRRFAAGPIAPAKDWSSHALDLMRRDALKEAEAVARDEFERSRDAHAFLLMVRAAYRDHRYFDVLQALGAAPEVLSLDTAVRDDLETLALEAYLQTERIHEAARMVDLCIERQGARPGLLLRKASVLGLMAKYDEARDVLLELNRRLGGRPAVLRRLVTVYEQLRDWESAESFRRALKKAETAA